MKRLPIYALGVVTLLVACGGSTAEEPTAAQIDAYVGEMSAWSGYTYGTVEHRSTGEQIEAGLEMCDDFREDAVLHMGTIEIAEAGGHDWASEAMWRALTLMEPRTSMYPEAGTDAFEAYFGIEYNNEP